MVDFNQKTAYYTSKFLLFEESGGPPKSVGTLQLGSTVVWPKMENVQIHSVFAILVIEISDFFQNKSNAVMHKILKKM